MNASHARADRTTPLQLPLMLLLLATASLAAALALFATGAWPYALILLGIGALLAAGFLELARRGPDAWSTGSVAASALSAREQAAAALDRLLARSSAAAEARRVRSAQALLRGERRAALIELGEAVYGGDDEAARTARERLDGIDTREEALCAQLAAQHAAAEERIRRSRLSVQKTVVKRVPEPYPPPDEGTPPTPAPVPEPYPPPQPKPDRESRRPAA